MKSQEYYRFISPVESNRESRERYLQVNCTGFCFIDLDFLNNTPGGRLDWYLQYVCGGTMITRIDGEDRAAPPGTFLIYPPKTPFHYRKRGEEALQYYWIHFTGTEAGPLLNRLRLPVRTVISCPGALERLNGLFERLYEEFLLRDACMDDITASMLIRILTLLSRSRDADREDRFPQRISSSLALIHQGLSEPLSVARLAEAEHLSLSQYRMVFRKLTGLSPSGYVASLRLERAKDRLSNSNLSVSQIAGECGYADPLYFSRLFKKKTGYSPSEYRRRHRNEV